MTVVESGKPTPMKAMKVTKPYAPALPELTPAQELALLARCGSRRATTTTSPGTSPTSSRTAPSWSTRSV
jgi:hypothetical protein